MLNDPKTRAFFAGGVKKIEPVKLFSDSDSSLEIIAPKPTTQQGNQINEINFDTQVLEMNLGGFFI